MAKNIHAQNQKPAEVLLQKIVINTGIGRLTQQSGFEDKILPQIERDLAMITVQKFRRCPAIKSISGLKVREGMIVGLSATLRRKKMVDFFERLITIVMPRIRDFNGIDFRNIDKNGVLNLGFKEQFVFPEINPEESFTPFSLGINVVPKVHGGIHGREEAVKIYRDLGLPFKK